MGHAVSSLTVTNPGDGYVYAPAVTITGGNATVNATAVATLASYGSINSIGVINGGSGFTNVPSISITPQGAGAVAGTVFMGVIGATPAYAGVGYNLHDTLSIVGGAGGPASVIVTQVTNTGGVQALGLVNAGSYTTLPTLVGTSTLALSGTGSGCTLNLTMGVITIAMTSGGSN